MIGVILVVVGVVTVKPSIKVDDPPPGAALVTMTSLGPAVAEPIIDISAFRLVPELILRLFTLIPWPNPVDVTPEINPDPVTVTLSVDPADPVAGFTVVIVGCGFVCPA